MTHSIDTSPSTMPGAPDSTDGRPPALEVQEDDGEVVGVAPAPVAGQELRRDIGKAASRQVDLVREVQKGDKLDSSPSTSGAKNARRNKRDALSIATQGLVSEGLRRFASSKKGGRTDTSRTRPAA